MFDLVREPFRGDLFVKKNVLRYLSKSKIGSSRHFGPTFLEGTPKRKEKFE